MCIGFWTVLEYTFILVSIISCKFGLTAITVGQDFSPLAIYQGMHKQTNATRRLFLYKAGFWHSWFRHVKLKLFTPIRF